MTHRREGYVDRIDNGWLIGWAWNPDSPRHPVHVDVYVGNALVATHEASLYRPDLEIAGKGDGRHAFEIPLPPIAGRGRGRVVFAGSQTDLIGSPFAIDAGSDACGAHESDQNHAFRSRFGGLWPDRWDAQRLMSHKVSDGTLNAGDEQLFRHWIDNGYVVLPQAVPHDLIDEIDREVESIWGATSASRLFVEFWKNDQRTIEPAGPGFKELPVKLLDLHAHSEAARRAAFAPAVLRFLTLLFEQPPLAFQSLYFRWGSGQSFHQDTAFVKVSSPIKLAASWIALEDIQPDSGELEYYVGSHRIEEYLFEGRHKWMPYRSEEYPRFIQWLRDECEKHRLVRERFRPRRGDVLLWNADLVHGGSPDRSRGLTRKSLVTHYCPGDCHPVYGNESDGRGIRHRFSEGAFYSAVR